MSQPAPLALFVHCLEKVPDPRSKRGVSQPFTTALAIVFLGLLAHRSTLAGIERWAKIHAAQLRQFLRLRKTGLPSDTTLSRILNGISLEHLQNAFAEFVNALVPDEPLIAAVDGKVAKQRKNENGDPILMLNVFAQKVRLHLASWSVRGDKTNEPGCLKQHLEELFTMYPCLKLLTGDAIYAQRPLLEAIQEYHCDYLVQIKKNQPKVLEQVKLIFEDAPKQTPNDRTVGKKRGVSRHVLCG